MLTLHGLLMQLASIQALWEQAKKKTKPRVVNLYYYCPGKLSNRFGLVMGIGSIAYGFHSGNQKSEKSVFELCKEKNRYFRRSHLSEAKSRLIMRYFTHDLAASKIAFRGKALIDGLIGLVPGLRPCLDFGSDRREIQ